ncbi:MULTISPECIES: hypothetical protein [unclassified Paenibacillus]|uniref:hypothetical protein n=1 Tax=unclassified Paenibacillus TaxID=185978 RepID=UPI0004F6962F|nr:hypothetical protein [Paenibacillus sp. FSL H8-0259]AIQ28313.1 hypothetical protein P40081_09080 [Paenibacillus sp. FSL P4-0081]OMF33130.1 hypothetical protein BK132_02575 [Paenibacillus sp. FSL H8-0259]
MNGNGFGMRISENRKAAFGGLFTLALACKPEQSQLILKIVTINLRYAIAVESGWNKGRERVALIFREVEVPLREIEIG